ncbi:2588_t:CDS:2, partial [Dentiscutata erythropus]
DPWLNTLKEIKQWFIQGNKKKQNPSQWFSAQCQFDLVLSVNGFFGIIEYVLNNCPGLVIQPRRISQDMLEGLFRTIKEMSAVKFKEILDDDLVMGWLERVHLIEYLLYYDSVDNLLISWSKKIQQMVLDSVPTKKGIHWMVTWLTNLEGRLNNYKCAGDWF